MTILAMFQRVKPNCYGNVETQWKKCQQITTEFVLTWALAFSHMAEYGVPMGAELRYTKIGPKTFCQGSPSSKLGLRSLPA